MASEILSEPEYSTGWHVRPTAVAYEGNKSSRAVVTWRINNVCVLPGSLESPPFYIRELPWRISIQREESNRKKMLGVYLENTDFSFHQSCAHGSEVVKLSLTIAQNMLEIARISIANGLNSAERNQPSCSSNREKECDGDSEDSSWNCLASYTFELRPQKEDVAAITHSAEKKFSEESSNWGCDFVQLKTIKDPKFGYNKDNSIILRVSVDVSEPLFNGEYYYSSSSSDDE